MTRSMTRMPVGGDGDTSYGQTYPPLKYNSASVSHTSTTRYMVPGSTTGYLVPASQCSNMSKFAVVYYYGGWVAGGCAGRCNSVVYSSFCDVFIGLEYEYDLNDFLALPLGRSRVIQSAVTFVFFPRIPSLL